MKPKYIYVDAIQKKGSCMFDVVYKWFNTIEGNNLLLPKISRDAQSIISSICRSSKNGVGVG